MLWSFGETAAPRTTSDQLCPWHIEVASRWFSRGKALGAVCAIAGHLEGLSCFPAENGSTGKEGNLLHMRVLGKEQGQVVSTTANHCVLRSAAVIPAMD